MMGNAVLMMLQIGVDNISFKGTLNVLFCLCSEFIARPVEVDTAL